MSIDRRPRLTAADRQQLAAHGLEASEVERQFALLSSPPPATRILRPCVPGDGILRLDPAELTALENELQEAAVAGRVSKFVPASGAASRMFADLLAARAGSRDPAAVAARETLVDNLHRLPFADRLQGTAESPQELLDALLAPQGLALAGRPKALVDFHRFGSVARTAFEEQLAEGAEMAVDGDDVSRLHFTIGSEHAGEFEQHLRAARERLEPLYGVRFEVDFSFQGPDTDTIALTPDGDLFRQGDGSLLLRPGGHGALLANLQATGGDIVLVKNIDNILPTERRPTAVRYKRLLGGLVVRLQRQIFALLAQLETAPAVAGEALAEALDFAARELQIGAARQYSQGPEEQARQFLRRVLDRPLRICGMVPNEGEPGGGPFWVEGRYGEAPQIVEAAQIDRDDPEQQAAVAAATHFNPVDLACALRDRHGKPYDLGQFVDPKAAFVSRKTAGERELVALEHPGLWNGAMADWTTVFVEVPAATFAPVKTVFDLLRPEHQPS